MAQSPTQEMDFFEKIGYAFNLWNESWEALKLNLLTFVILYLLPLGLTMLLAIFYLVPIINDAAGNTTLSTASLVVAIIATFVVAFVYVVLYPVITLTQLESAKGNKVSVGEVFNRGIKYLPAYIVLALVLVGAIGIPFLLAIVLIPFVIGILLLPLAFVWAVFVSVFVMIVPYIIINDNLGGIDAIKKAIEIVKVKWQWVLAVYTIFIVASIAGYVPLIGGLVSLAITVVYFCMPAIVYLRHIAEKPATATVAEKSKKSVTKKQTTKKKSVAKK